MTNPKIYVIFLKKNLYFLENYNFIEIFFKFFFSCGFNIFHDSIRCATKLYADEIFKYSVFYKKIAKVAID